MRHRRLRQVQLLCRCSETAAFDYLDEPDPGSACIKILYCFNAKNNLSGSGSFANIIYAGAHQGCGLGGDVEFPEWPMMRFCTALQIFLRNLLGRTTPAGGGIIVLSGFLSATAAIGGGMSRPALDTARLERDQPFASTGVGITQGPLPDKWQLALADIHSEIAILAGCRARPDQCLSPEAARFLKIVERARPHEGFAKLAVVNSGVNAAIQRATDMQQPRVDDPWPTALATFASGRGVCTHFAIAKYTALLLGGWRENDLRLVMVWPNGAGVSHMVLAARHNGQWQILDNTRSAIIIDTKLTNYVPLLVFDLGGASQLVSTHFHSNFRSYGTP
jgi:predicted transglutaminase-like cysteine proteinase